MKKNKTMMSKGIKICVLLLIFHNPFSGYDSTYQKFDQARFFSSPRDNGYVTMNHESFLNYTSNNAMFPWIESLGQFLGMVIPILLYCRWADNKEGREK